MINTWRLCIMSRKDTMVIYCHELKMAKSFIRPEGIHLKRNKAQREAFISEFVDDYYKGKLVGPLKLEPWKDHMRYIQKASVKSTYIVDTEV